jgi:hypothetical protein|tara:strand:- start:479 stop:1087 length:609 start_codon:yes stop_codon:yes gene_type:complete
MILVRVTGPFHGLDLGVIKKDFKMKRAIHFLTVSIAVGILSGCVSSPKQETPGLSAYEKAILTEYQRTEEVLSKAALISSRSLMVMARTKQAKEQPTLTAEQVRLARAQNNYIPIGMEVIESIPWDGAPEPLLFTIASMAGYQLEFSNQAPPISKDVTISSDQRNLRELIAAIEQQTPNYIEEIDIDDKAYNKKITIKYVSF